MAIINIYNGKTTKADDGFPEKPVLQALCAICYVKNGYVDDERCRFEVRNADMWTKCPHCGNDVEVKKNCF